MNRRNFLLAAASVPIALKTAIAEPAKYGLMTIQRYQALKLHGVHLRVLLNGVDVTGRCKLAHDTDGWAYLYKQKNGHAYVDPYDPSGAAMETLRGDVRFERS